MADETREDVNQKESARKARGDNRRITVAEALAKLPGAKGERFATVLEYGGLLVEIYAPRGHDPQSPHTRDEAYIVMQGSGEFLNGTERHIFGAGDFLFVPAGVEHRFENFTDDLVLWVIFCGPEGGEALAGFGKK
ncbi:MAG: cupin domain-containing protein [Pyrinomonadaceae bacterium]|nr:cupin domain-containing protein [Pyrinomonadaceae bacterium]